jgi:hypothetical protein
MNGKFLHTLPETLQRALGIIQKCCNMRNLSFKPIITVKMPFTRKSDVRRLKKPPFFSETIHLSSEVKYLRLKVGLRTDVERAADWDNQ